MCGIFAGISPNILSELISGLSMLEYRGYDSSGITTINKGKLNTAKIAGKFKELKQIIKQDGYHGTAGIGHVRWATHGAPTTINAHPHGTENVSIVHNGIIENYLLLKIMLEKVGYQFESQTDTEIVAKLLDYELTKLNSTQALQTEEISDIVMESPETIGWAMSPAKAAHNVFDILEGSYSLVCLFARHDDLLIGSCNRTPLIAGLFDDKNSNKNAKIYLSSDVNAFPDHVNKVIYLQDGDRIFIKGNTYNIFDSERNLVIREVVDSHDKVQVNKGKYAHYMSKEIAEQPSIIEHIVRTYLKSDKNNKFANIDINWQNLSRINIVACGSAYFAGLTAMYWLEELTGIPVSVEIASEYIYRKNAQSDSTLVIVISQSGETLDTLEALKKAKAAGSYTLAVINVEHSTIAREAKYVLPIFAGPEIGVASTKAFTAQLAVLAALSIFINKKLNQQQFKQSEGNDIFYDKLDDYNDVLKETSKIIDYILTQEDKILDMAQAIKNSKSVLYLGRGNLYPIALEGALKLKELSYIHAEGYPGGELKHGPISLVEKNLPVICLMPSSKLGEKMLSNMQEVKARDGDIFAIMCDDVDSQVKKLAKAYIEIPKHHEFASPIIFSICLQMLSYHVCNLLGNDPDQPRNLAKSVTVE